MCSTSCSRRSDASSEPCSSNCWWAWASASSRSTTLAPMVLRIFRSSAWAQVAPKSPVEAPMTATGLLRRTLVAIGREIQSRAFLSAPGTDATDDAFRPGARNAECGQSAERPPDEVDIAHIERLEQLGDVGRQLLDLISAACL